MHGDTSLIRLIIVGLVQKYNWTYEDTMEKFYQSKICRKISDRATGAFTFAPRELIWFLEEEWACVHEGKGHDTGQVSIS